MANGAALALVGIAVPLYAYLIYLRGRAGDHYNNQRIERHGEQAGDYYDEDGNYDPPHE
jgi:hypothetical protein